MSELKKEILENGIHYTLVGGYYFPTCTLADNNPFIGKWADQYEQHLRENRPSEYARLIWSNELNDLLQSVQNACVEQIEKTIRQMCEYEGITEQLKSIDQLEWVKRMNNIRNRAEELVISEMIR